MYKISSDNYIDKTAIADRIADSSPFRTPQEVRKQVQRVNQV